MITKKNLIKNILKKMRMEPRFAIGDVVLFLRDHEYYKVENITTNDITCFYDIRSLKEDMLIVGIMEDYLEESNEL